MSERNHRRSRRGRVRCRPRTPWRPPPPRRGVAARCDRVSRRASVRLSLDDSKISVVGKGTTRRGRYLPDRPCGIGRRSEAAGCRPPVSLGVDRDGTADHGRRAVVRSEHESSGVRRTRDETRGVTVRAGPRGTMLDEAVASRDETGPESGSDAGEPSPEAGVFDRSVGRLPESASISPRTPIGADSTPTRTPGWRRAGSRRHHRSSIPGRRPPRRERLAPRPGSSSAF